MESDRRPPFVSGLMRLDFYLIDLQGASCLNILETVAVKMRRDMNGLFKAALFPRCDIMNIIAQRP